MTTSYGYDSRGRLYSTTVDVPGMPGGSKRVTRVPFESGNPLRVTYPSGTSVEYGYDRLARAEWMAVTDPNNTGNTGARVLVDSTSFTADGNVSVLRRGSTAAGGVLNSYYAYYGEEPGRYGDSGRLYSSWTHAGGGSPVDQHFFYDYSDAGLLKRVKESTEAGSVDQCFTYDQAARLTRAWTEQADGDYCATPGSDSNGFEPFEVSYSFDPVGRITAATGSGTVDGAYTYGSGPAHAPTRAGGNTYSYDAAGNRIGSTVDGRSRTYTYDALSRLVTSSGDVSSAMLYDASGQRVRRTVDGDTTWYLSNGLEIDEAGIEKISLGAATYSNGEVWAHNLDHLGTPGYTVSWATGAETYRRFTPFGTPRSAATDNAAGASDLTFTGQRDDGALDLLYYGGRFYDPVLGQFTRPDPLSVDGPNRFAYVLNNPLLFVDPSGLCSALAAATTGSGSCTLTTRPSRSPASRSTPRFVAPVSSFAPKVTSRVPARPSGSVSNPVLPVARGFVDRGGESLNEIVQAVTSPVQTARAVGQTATSCGPSVTAVTCLGVRTVEATAVSYRDAYEREGLRYAVGYAGFDVVAAIAGPKATRAVKRTPPPPTGPGGLSPSSIRFSQSSVNNVDEIALSMRANGWVGDPIDVVRMPDGSLATLDNTRVLAAYQAGIDVRAIVRAFDDPLTTEMAERFATARGGVPSTWGEAITNRIGSQNAGYRTAWPGGSPFTGWRGN